MAYWPLPPQFEYASVGPTAGWPLLRRRAAVACTLGWLVLAGAIMLTLYHGLPPQSAIQTVAAFALVNLLLWRWLPQHLPQRYFGAANGVTLARACGIALLAGLIGVEAAATLVWPLLALGLALLIADGIDGWLARRYQRASVFGARFDMEIDALFVLVLAVLVWQFEKAGPWVVLAGLWRYAFAVAGWLHPPLAAPLAPSRRRQTVCVAQIVALLVCLCPLVASAISAPLALASLLGLSLSFVLDLRRLLLQEDA